VLSLILISFNGWLCYKLVCMLLSFTGMLFIVSDGSGGDIALYKRVVTNVESEALEPD